jgi:RNA polymerase sigma factor (sigma-70 family)
MKSKIDASDFLNVAEIVARKFHFGKEQIKDTEFYSICCLRLVEIASQYDGVKNDFFKFAYASCLNAIIDYLRKGKRLKNTASFQELDSLEWQDLKAQSNLFSDNMKEEVFDFLTQSDDPQMKLIFDYYLDNKKISDIAKQSNVSNQTIHVRIRHALLNLSHQFNHHEKITDHGKRTRRIAS